MRKILKKLVAYQTRASTLLESLLTLAVTCFLVLSLSGNVSGIFQKVEESLFFLSFENLYRDTQKLSAAKQDSMVLEVSSEKISNGVADLKLPKTVRLLGGQNITFDQAGGNSSLSKIQFKTEKEKVTYQLYLGSGNYKKTHQSLRSP